MMDTNNFNKGYLKGVPYAIILAMLREQVLQTGKLDETIFVKSLAPCAVRGGFDFYGLWAVILVGCRYNLFFKKI